MNPTLLISLIALALISISTISILKIDNTDHNPFVSKVDDKFLMLQSEEKYLEETQEIVQDSAQSDPFIDSLNTLQEKAKGACIGGVDPDSLTEDLKLDAFNKGPCGPAILIPGIGGTQLQVAIDCEVLQANHPDIFQNCGWGTCSWYNIFYSKPSSEYRLWLADAISKTSPFTIKSNNKCFGDLIGQFYNTNSKVAMKDRYTGPSGLKVTWFGNTIDSKKDSDCGARAIQDLSTFAMNKLSCSLTGFKNVISTLKVMGYQSGITFQAIPYDFRQHVQIGEPANSIPKAVDNLYEFTGKKVTIIGHSYGTLNTLYALTKKISQATKDQKIHAFLAAGPPFLGSPKAIQPHTGGNPDFVTKMFNRDIGINFYNQDKLFSSAPGIMELYLKDSFDKFTSEIWYQKFQQRLQWENDILSKGFSTLKNPFPIIPGPDKTCFYGHFAQQMAGNCTLALVDYSKEEFMTVAGKQYKSTFKDVQDILSYHTLHPIEFREMHREIQESGLNDMPNPGVPTIILYGNAYKSEKSITYLKNPLDILNQKKSFYFPEQDSPSRGDGTVMTVSAVTPGLKWDQEFQDKLPNANPVKFIEYCSQKNQYTGSIYDVEDTVTKERLFNKSEYKGLQCTCNEGTDEKYCVHSCFPGDPYFVKFVMDVLKTKEKSNSQQSFVSDKLKQWQADCPTLNSDDRSTPIKNYQ